MRLFNETVLRAPDLEGGSDDTTFESDTDAVDTGGDSGDTGDAGSEGSPEEANEKPLSVREQLKKSIAEVNAENEKQQKPSGKPKTQQQLAAQQPPAAAQPQTTATPAALAKEAHGDWEKTPLSIQQAFIKREQDMQKGVDELKGRYALIDQAIQPHSDALRRMNASPAEAVNRMFLWFKALEGNPATAFPGLAKSFGIDWNKLVAASGGQAQPQPGQQQAAGQQPQQQAEIPDPVKQYIGELEQRLQQMDGTLRQVQGQYGAIQNDINTTAMQKTEENLTFWSKDKEFFNDVRQQMAKLVEAGIVPLKNGQVDLDTVYEHAIYSNPEVRAKVLAKQQQANTEVQQAQVAEATATRQNQANRARKAAVSIPSGNAPGALNGAVPPQRKSGQRTSVRDSLKQAIAQVRDI